MSAVSGATSGEREGPSLVLARDRDAFAAIRGFVYQAELTILRWLELGEQEALELERGEDVDLVRRAVAGGDVAEFDRLMEQVKHREKRVTLRTQGLRSALANFFEHRHLNPGLSLRFRFTTNALPGREAGGSLPGHEPGIEAWGRLHAGGLAVQEEEELIAALRELLRSGSQPEDIKQESWERWQDFVAASTDAELLAFVQQVEIATGAASAESLRPAIEQALLDEGHAGEPRRARHLYTVLVVAVVKLLGTPGVKRLTRNDLAAELSGVGPGSEDAAMASRLDELLAAIALRIAEVEGKVDAVAADLGEVRHEVSALSATVEAGRAPPGARPGDSRTFQTTQNYFGRELDPSSTFNHARGLAGREAVLERGLEACREAIEDGSGVVVVGGAGGVGKSRILLEMASQLEASGAFAVRWIRDRVTPDPDALNELPEGPVAIFCDDAHRRADLESVYGLVEMRRDATVVVVGTRPRGRDALRIAAFQAGIAMGQIMDLGDLPEVEHDELVRLVAAELGEGDKQWAEPVVRVARGSTLVSLVAARLLRTRRLNPGILSQDKEVHFVVLSSFEEEVYGNVGRDVDAGLARRTLELVAAIGPLPVRDAELMEAAARFAGTDRPALLQAVGALQEAGVLREHRRGIRIAPDILADHILQRMLVAAGRPTQQEIKIVDELGLDVLPNLLRNVADLDWQLATAEGLEGAGPSVDIFSALWERFAEEFRTSSNYRRLEYLKRLRAVAPYQPRKVMALCEWLAEHPENPPGTPTDEAWKSSTVLAEVPPLLAVISQHEDYFDRAVNLLWALGRSDSRDLNPHPEHAIRMLEEVVRYAPGRQVWRQERALLALRRWTSEPGWSLAAHSPLVVARAILRTATVEEAFDPRTNVLKMTRHGVNPTATRAAREQTVRLLSDLALGAETRGRMWASEVLLNALDPPESQFGHVVSDDEEDAFRPQYEAAFEALERIADGSTDSLVRVKLRDGLQWAARRSGLEWKRERALQVGEGFAESEETEFARAWGRIFRDASSSWQEAMRRGDDLIARVADRLALENDAEVIFARFAAEQERFEEAGVPAVPGYLLDALSQRRPDHAAALARRVLHSDDNDRAAVLIPWLHVTMIVLRRLDPGSYGELFRSAAEHRDPRVRAAVSHSLRWAQADVPWDGQERDRLRALLVDPDASVRTAAVGALDRLPAGERADFLRHVDVGGSPSVANAVAEHWAHRPPSEWPEIDPEQTARLLNMLLDLPDLGAHSSVDEMLGALARSEPTKVLDFLMERVRREGVGRSEAAAGGEGRYDAIPYGGLHGVWAALQSSPEHPEIVRMLLEAVVEEARSETWSREALSVARKVLHWDDEVERSLDDWMDAGRCDAIVALDRLFAAQPPAFLLDRREFVARLVSWMAERECVGREDVERALASSVLAAVRTRRKGVPNDLDFRLRADASAFAAELEGRSDAAVAAAFYRFVAREAERRLDSERERDERDREFAASFEWDNREEWEV